jgi:hypothetical protein
VGSAQWHRAEFRPPAAPGTQEHIELRLSPAAAGTALTLRASSRRNPWRARAAIAPGAGIADHAGALRNRRTRHALTLIVQALIVVPLYLWRSGRAAG